jgi:molybdate transport system permease protein
MIDPFSAIRLSIWVATLSVLICTVPAVALGRLVAVREFRGKFLVHVLALAPLVSPPVITGLVMLRLFGRNGPFGALFDALGVRVVFGPWGAVVAAAVLAFPLYYNASRQAFEAVDPRYEQVARTLGMTPLRAFWRVGLPLAAPGVASGAVIAFARSLGEFGATVVVAGNTEGETRTIALAVYALLESSMAPQSVRSVLFVASLVLAGASVLVSESLAQWHRRRLAVHGG